MEYMLRFKSINWKGEIVMAAFIMLGKYTSESLKSLSPERTEQAIYLIKKCGGEVKSIYALLGNHDLIVIVDYPGVKQAMKASIALNRLTGIAFTTSQAISVEEFDKIITEI
jgi:uncharacterized protein with GYD domain